MDLDSAAACTDTIKARLRDRKKSNILNVDVCRLSDTGNWSNTTYNPLL